MNTETYKVLSIDAWREPEGWTWNTWYDAGTIELETLDSTRKVLSAMRDAGYLSDDSKGRVCLDNDQYNIVVCDRSNGEPLFAIEYGSKF